MMPFIGLKKSVWKNLFQYDSSQDDVKNGKLGFGLPQMIENYDRIFDFSGKSTWGIDQTVFTYEILKTGLCSLPQNHILWEKLNIGPDVKR